MVRPLSEELQKKAVEELNEVPERVPEDIKFIQEWIGQQPYLNAPTDEQWILGFLRGCKFSLQTTKEKIDTFYTVKAVMPELMKSRDVSSYEVQEVLKAGIVLPLPYPKDYIGPRVILFRFENCDTSIVTVENLTVVYHMIIHILMKEDDNMSVSGILIWCDMEHYPLSFILQLTPTFLKKFFLCFLRAFPLRIKGILTTGSPSLAERVFSMLMVFMTPKLRSRIKFYSESTFEKLFNDVPKSYVPVDYGGENDSVDNISSYWKKKVESYADWFAENDQFCTNEAKRPGKPIFDDISGIDGSFRKLNVD